MDNDHNNEDTVDSSDYKVPNVGFDAEHESTVIEITGMEQDLLAKVSFEYSNFVFQSKDHKKSFELLK